MRRILILVAVASFLPSFADARDILHLFKKVQLTDQFWAEGAHYADFNRDGHGQINHLYGGRGCYFEDLDGHLMEIITRPYGPTPERWTASRPNPA